jgi:DNA repair protein RadC
MKAVRNYNLDSEMFGENGRYYFLDLNMAGNATHYLAITRSDKLEDNKYRRSRLILFEEDIPFFVEALTMMLTRYSHGEGRPA